MPNSAAPTPDSPPPIAPPSAANTTNGADVHGFALERMHVEVGGPEGAPPVVMLHGWGSSAALMRPMAQMLTDERRVHNLDLPGHGRTPPPPHAWGVPEYAELVAAYVRTHIGPGPYPFVGHSNGGRISLFMASTDAYAGLISKLVLVSPSGVTPPRGMSYHVKKNVARVLKAPVGLLPRAWQDEAHTHLRHSLVWSWLGSSDYQNLDEAMRGTFVKTVGFHVDDQLGRVGQPTLLFWGDGDTAVRRVQMETLERELQDAGLVTLPGAGHYGYLDAPDIVAAGARQFLGLTEREVGPGPAKS
jgi:pimeloyl-ACP methyl ester carboxylesterase